MAGTTRIDLLSNAGPGNGADFIVQAGKYALLVAGTFGGGSVSLEIKSPEGTYLPITNGSLLQNGMLLIELPAGQVRAAVVTATGVFAHLITVPTITTR